MIKAILTLLIFVTAFFYIKEACYGDTVKLKNGIVLTGDIILETDNDLVIKTDRYGVAKVKKGVIGSIEYTQSQEVNYNVSSNFTGNISDQSFNTNMSDNKQKKSSRRSDEFHIMLGINASFSPNWLGYTFNFLPTIPGFDRNFIYLDSYPFFDMNTGIFVDLKYARLDFSYGFSLGNTVTYLMKAGQDFSTPFTGTTFMTNNATNTNSFSYLKIGLVLKYPINVSDAITIWPAAGFEYVIPLTYTINNSNVITNSYYDLNDFWLKAGIGVNIRLASRVYLVPTAYWALNLTPLLYKDTTADPVSMQYSFSDVKYSGYWWRLDFGISIAFEL